MSDINTVTISGRLTRDPELRHTESGTAVANTGIATERYRKEGENDVSFVNLTIWSGFGELVAKKARKGDFVTLQGRLNQNTWEKDGEKRSSIEVIVDTMVGEFMYRKGDGSDTPERGEQTASQSAPAAQDDDIPF